MHEINEQAIEYGNWHFYFMIFNISYTWNNFSGFDNETLCGFFNPSEYKAEKWVFPNFFPCVYI